MRLVTSEIVEWLSLATVGVNSLELSFRLYDKYILVFAENAVNLVLVFNLNLGRRSINV